MVCAGAVIVRDSADTEGRATTGDRVTPPDESLDCSVWLRAGSNGRPEAHFSDGWGKCVPTKPHRTGVWVVGTAARRSSVDPGRCGQVGLLAYCSEHKSMDPISVIAMDPVPDARP
jgi:hypothetical protein